jgi:hypothetical protein
MDPIPETGIVVHAQAEGEVRQSMVGATAFFGFLLKAQPQTAWPEEGASSPGSYAANTCILI